MDLSSISSFYNSQITEENKSKTAAGISNLKNADLSNATDDELMIILET